MPRRRVYRPNKADLISTARRRGLKGDRPLSRMNLAQLRALHDEAADVATDEDQTLSVIPGSASTVLAQGGSGIRLAGRGHCGVQAKPKPKPGLQGSGNFRDLVKKHKGDMKAASQEYKQQKGSGVTDMIEKKIKGKIKHKVFQKGDAAIDKQVSNPALRAALHAGLHAGVDTLAGSGKAPLDVQEFLNHGASDDMEGGSVSQVLDKLATGSALAGAATAATGVGAAATPFLEGAAGVAKVGSEIADLFGYGDMDVRQYMV
jgi:hypothetical protein